LADELDDESTNDDRWFHQSRPGKRFMGRIRRLLN